ncbi:anaerobic ribonucleoside-triphosphate reductase activating protein [Lachnospiraceae bacterium WCA-9-b2]|jgi:anaerobic ribonucleoside-triphosphate reductase activating protein|uniref:Anaerobic ribonucleoside-triphosphate reductase activating protein n=1 Tax=Sporofaciens musculi TaxID=2681861 RepID=A0A7X3MJK0_9FIRM|nr:anaerobic ribonucleoside-triphosphate reductase activating protein [Sporofaciens musculi]MXP77618.1 anaerobic ribonucleoside-triphosphate reductase activating protein [Sporofaciens musculi]
MVIQGLKKFSLLDYPGKMACTVFTAGCNFRCPYCYYKPLVIDTHKNTGIPVEDVYTFLEKYQGILDGVCLTGGEPLIQHGVEEFLRRVKELGYAVKLETNGSFPDKLKRIVSEGLISYVAMDIKNSLESYGKTVGIEGYDVENVKKSAEFLLSNAVPYEFCTTVVLEYHQRSDFESIGKWITKAEQYYLQRFLNSEHVIQKGLHKYNDNIMEQALAIVRKKVPSAKLRGW